LSANDTRTAASYAQKVLKLVYPLRVQYPNYKEASELVGSVDKFATQSKLAISEFQQKEVDKVVVQLKPLLEKLKLEGNNSTSVTTILKDANKIAVPLR
jgi:hypothetical protein